MECLLRVHNLLLSSGQPFIKAVFREDSRDVQFLLEVRLFGWIQLYVLHEDFMRCEEAGCGNLVPVLALATVFAFVERHAFELCLKS